LDDDYLEDLKVELIQGQRLAADEDGAVLVWIGTPDVSPTPPPSAPQPALSGPRLATPTVHDPYIASKRSRGRSEKFLPGDAHVVYHRGP
jgi:hypothetical protein